MGWVACKDGSWAVNGGGLDAEALPWLRKYLAGSIKLHTAHLSRFRSRKSDGGAFFMVDLRVLPQRLQGLGED